MSKDFKKFLDFISSEKVIEEWAREKDVAWNSVMLGKKDEIAVNDAIDYSEIYANNWTLFALHKYHEWLAKPE